MILLNKNERLFVAAWIAFYIGLCEYPLTYMEEHCNTDYDTVRWTIDDDKVQELLDIAKEIVRIHPRKFPL